MKLQNLLNYKVLLLWTYGILNSMLGIFVVSTNHAEPLDMFHKLNQQQHQQQHQAPKKLPRWFCPNIFKYYVLLHDVTDGEESKYVSEINISVFSRFQILLRDVSLNFDSMKIFVNVLRTHFNRLYSTMCMIVMKVVYWVQLVGVLLMSLGAAKI